MSFYPGGVTPTFGADYSIFDEFARVRGTGADDPTYVEDVWLEKYRKDCKRYNSKDCSNCSASCHTESWMSGSVSRMAEIFWKPQPDNVLVIPYTNAQVQ